MEKSFLKKKLPNLIIIEGLWGMGKTSFANNISKISNHIIISEPDHKNSKIIENLSEWYYKQHKKTLKKLKNGLGKQKILMDRSIISNAAYQYATTGIFAKNNFIKIFNLIDSLDSVVLFFYSDRNFIIKKINNIKNNDIKNLILNDKYFYKQYVYFYKNLLPKYFKNKIFYIKINDGDRFIKKQKIISSFIKNFEDKNKIKSICAASLAYYKKKILLIYDHNRNHYVLPQGHQKKKESLQQTVTREFTEETGYINLKIIKKLKKYQYNYLKDNDIIYKKINVFLLEIINKKQINKRLEKHENYSNHLFNPNEAIKKLKWKEDKKIVKIFQKFLNKKGS
jgi:8-oxo-dGTP pyrophosphatase MutT (NUDIX family)/thymidylate kinase